MRVALPDQIRQHATSAGLARTVIRLPPDIHQFPQHLAIRCNPNCASARCRSTSSIIPALRLPLRQRHKPQHRIERIIQFMCHLCRQPRHAAARSRHPWQVKQQKEPLFPISEPCRPSLRIRHTRSLVWCTLNIGHSDVAAKQQFLRFVPVPIKNDSPVAPCPNEPKNDVANSPRPRYFVRPTRPPNAPPVGKVVKQN